MGNSIFTTVGSCPGDFVEINDGILSQKYCGSSIPEPTTSTGTDIVVKFSSGQGIGSTGFLAMVCCSVQVTTELTSGELSTNKVSF